MAIDAIIVSGGRGSRLGGAAKGALVLNGMPLLDRTVAAVPGARAIVVAGPVGDTAGRARVVREEPPFAGPAAGIVAALRALPDPAPDDRVLVLACDLVHPAELVAALLVTPPARSILVRAGGRPQYLVGIHDARALRAAGTALPGGGAALPVHRLLEPLRPAFLDLPAGLATDIDTWGDAAAAGVARPAPRRQEEPV